MERGAFKTTDGVAITVVTADELRTIDEVATDGLGLSLLQMMEILGVIRTNLSRSPTGVTLHQFTPRPLVCLPDHPNGPD